MSNSVSRQSFLGLKAPAAFEEQRIGIIGLCGGGSHIAQQLAHIGFNQLILCDFDHVEDTNLTRMIGSRPSDAQSCEKKTNVIHRMVVDINPNISVEIIESKWQQQAELLRSCSVIFGCVDSLTARDELERFCRRYLIPYIDLGMDVHKINDWYAISGQVVTSLPDHPCMRCMGVLRDDEIAKEHARYGAAGGRPQVVWPNGILASAAIGQYMSLILPWGKDQIPSLFLEYDGNRQLIRESVKLSYLENLACPHYPQSMKLGDPFYSGLVIN
jgi:hypothetical protein